MTKAEMLARGRKIGAPLGGHATYRRRIAIHAPGIASAAGHKSNHLRYHVRRGYVHPGCDLCVAVPDPIEKERLRAANLAAHPRMRKANLDNLARQEETPEAR